MNIEFFSRSWMFWKWLSLFSIAFTVLKWCHKDDCQWLWRNDSPNKKVVPSFNKTNRVSLDRVFHIKTTALYLLLDFLHFVLHEKHTRSLITVRWGAFTEQLKCRYRQIFLKISKSPKFTCPNVISGLELNLRKRTNQDKRAFLSTSCGRDFLTCSWILKNARDGSLDTMWRFSDNFSVTGSKKNVM